AERDRARREGDEGGGLSVSRNFSSRERRSGFLALGLERAGLEEALRNSEATAPGWTRCAVDRSVSEARGRAR
ncbi:MAG TPA: hypothetical protein VK116_09830, partial [Planctomycetota bacterium]|nr:hypothetical protein [Planctomycetota bacterium]